MKNIKLVLIFLTIAGILFATACSGNSAYAGRYTKDDFYIELNSDGSFTAQNYISLKGSYKVDGTKVIFNIKNMNGKDFENTANGKLEGDTLTGPDGFVYTKSK